MSKRFYKLLMYLCMAFVIVGFSTYKPTVVKASPIQDVAEIGSNKYTGLQAAFDALQPEETIKLLDDIILEGDMVINNGFDFTFDLNSHTINQQGNSITFSGAGTLTIMDSSEGKTGKITGSGPSVIILNSGKSLKIKSGTLEGTESKEGVIKNKSAGSVTIDGGNVSLIVNSGLLGSYRGISNESTGSINIKSGKVTVTADVDLNNIYCGISNYVSGANVIISGGEVSVIGGNANYGRYIAIFNNNSCNVEMTGGKVSVIAGSGSNSQYFGIKNNGYNTVTISGGEVSVTGDAGSAGDYYGIYSEYEGNTITISGGEVNVTAGSGTGEHSYGIFFKKQVVSYLPPVRWTVLNIRYSLKLVGL